MFFSITLLSVDSVAVDEPIDEYKQALEASLISPDKSIESIKLSIKGTSNSAALSFYHTLLGQLYYFKGHIDKTTLHYKLAKDASKNSNSWAHAYLLMHLSLQQLEQGKMEQAKADVRRALDGFVKWRDIEMQIKAKTYLGAYLLWTEDAAASFDVLSQAYKLSQNEGVSEQYQTYINNVMGAYYSVLGNYEQAITLKYKALQNAQKHNHWVDVMYSYYGLCPVYVRAGRLKEAQACYQQARPVASEFNIDRAKFWVPFGLARIAYKQQYEKTISYMEQAKQYEWTTAHNPVRMTVLRLEQAQAYLALNQAELALNTVLQASDLLKQFESRYYNRYERQLLFTKAKSLDALEHDQHAIEILFKYIDLEKKARENEKLKLEKETRVKFETDLKETKIKLADKQIRLQQASLKALMDENKLRTLYILLTISILVGVSVFAYKQKQLSNAMLNLANTDPLTQSFNRRYMVKQLEALIRYNQRHHLALSVILLDIDKFKNVNDTYGHDVGDEVLIEVANRITQQYQRANEFIARIGGEEFVVVLPGTDMEQAVESAQKLCSVIRDKPISGNHLTVTVSCGVAQMTDADDSVDSILKQADTKLYEAKNTGRNKVMY
ncbi:tetratricopeptide repeat-containing diguanylate cyclase [Pseudoalteromonas luteoviolacea]|uniref:diguanylate cyclase n=1 Tax=Pseudoalteromonas luteoviolacea S4060-1 TaxID=1365257 RepID=A0A161Z1X0_9GAMM|nr:diguanylate cyclase [Pseudoalteromonas luteoviolacea]KZN70439.1 hypothetical protein N478_00620 [Pseudoalteromonas luteoviolacea S4060-1]